MNEDAVISHKSIKGKLTAANTETMEVLTWHKYLVEHVTRHTSRLVEDMSIIGELMKMQGSGRTCMIELECMCKLVCLIGKQMLLLSDKDYVESK